MSAGGTVSDRLLSVDAAGEPGRRTVTPVLVFPHAHQRGGVERVVWQALKAFAERGPVCFVGIDIDPPIPGVRHLAVANPRRSSALEPLLFRVRAAREIRRAAPVPSVTLTFGANCPPGDVKVAGSVHRAWLARGRPALVRGRAVPNSVRRLLPRHRVLLALERSYFRPGGRIVVVADQLKSDVNEFYGVDMGDAVTIHNGYSAAQCSPERRAANRNEMRREWGIGPDAVALLIVANELHRKGFATLIDAVALVGDPRLEVHLVGKASPEGFTRRIAELGLQGRVHYHGSVDTGRVHAAADALVLPTQYEAFALTIVEGLASGLPVVTTTVPGAGDRIEHGVSGLLCQNPTDASELAGCLRRLLDPVVRDRLGAAAPAAVADLEWNEVMGQLYELCQQTARGGTPNSASDEKQLAILAHATL